MGMLKIPVSDRVVLGIAFDYKRVTSPFAVNHPKTVTISKEEGRALLSFFASGATELPEQHINPKLFFAFKKLQNCVYPVAPLVTRTRCVVFECNGKTNKDASIITEGVTYCSPKDIFNKETGRRESLANAVKTLPEHVRGALWKGYFERPRTQSHLETVVKAPVEGLSYGDVKGAKVDV